MFKEKILDTIIKYKLIEKGDKLVIGVSGGPDSISLLNVLYEIKHDENIEFDFVVAHINHNIREEAKSDEEYVIEFCKKRDIEVYVLSIDIKSLAKQRKKGTEEVGRIERYNFFENILEKTDSNKIATAHTANDNAETVLMNIIRGSGTSGLKGIKPIRNNKFIRPLIETTREKIEEYCAIKKLNPRIDKTNFENNYTRNKIRNILIPSIEETFNPNIIDCINRLSRIADEEDEYIESVVIDEYTEIRISEQENKEIVLDLKKFNSKNMVIKKRLILYTINRLQGNVQGIGKIHIDDLIKLCEKNLGNKYLTPNKHIKVLVKNKKIYFNYIKI